MPGAGDAGQPELIAGAGVHVPGMPAGATRGDQPGRRAAGGDVAGEDEAPASRIGDQAGHQVAGALGVRGDDHVAVAGLWRGGDAAQVGQRALQLGPELRADHR